MIISAVSLSLTARHIIIHCTIWHCAQYKKIFPKITVHILLQQVSHLSLTIFQTGCCWFRYNPQDFKSSFANAITVPANTKIVNKNLMIFMSIIMIEPDHHSAFFWVVCRNTNNNCHVWFWIIRPGSVCKLIPTANYITSIPKPINIIHDLTMITLPWTQHGAVWPVSSSIEHASTVL